MTGASPLERGYRRLPACYPAQYRRIHQEEMLAVLMAAAPDGKRRPGIAETADLAWSALRIRCQPQRDRAAGPAWRDALAVLSVILPLFFLLTYIVQETQILLIMPGTFSYGFPMWALTPLASPFAMAALVLLRLRRVAAVAAVALLTWLVYLSRPGQVSDFHPASMAFLFLALGLEIAALTASPGPRRGLQILTWKHSALIVITAVAVGTIGRFPVPTAVPVIVLAVICAAMALASPLGRWLLVLLAIPVYPFAVEALYFTPAPGLSIAVTWLPPLALLILAGTAARRESLRSP